MHERDVQPERRLSVDEEYAYTGYHRAGGVCRIQIWEGPGQVPVIMATELAENTKTSITNMAEYLAAEIIARHLPQRYEHEESIIWLERYPQAERHGGRELPEYAVVEFADFKPRIEWVGWQQRMRIGQPAWRHIEEVDVRELIGGRWWKLKLMSREFEDASFCLQVTYPCSYLVTAPTLITH